MTAIEETQRTAASRRLLAGLAGDEHGRNGSGPPLVLLHGLTFDRSTWGPALGELDTVDPGRRVLALDLPGHGESAGRASYRLDEVAEQIHEAVRAAGLAAPVLVGHSISAMIATVYAARYVTSGVVNVDQTLHVEPFAALVQSAADRLEGDSFDEVWEMFRASMGAELLPRPALELVRATSRPRQDVVVGYWRDALDRSLSELAAWAASCLAELRSRGVPYLVVSGDELDAGYRAWLAEVLPQATVTVLPGSGHFPHLAHPRLFAECLAAFGTWSAAWSYVR